MCRPPAIRAIPSKAEILRSEGDGSTFPEIRPITATARKAKPATTKRLSRLLSPRTFNQSLILRLQPSQPETKNSFRRLPAIKRRESSSFVLEKLRLYGRFLGLGLLTRLWIRLGRFYS